MRSSQSASQVGQHFLINSHTPRIFFISTGLLIHTKAVFRNVNVKTIYPIQFITSNNYWTIDFQGIILIKCCLVSHNKARSVYLKVGAAKVHCYCQLKLPLEWVQMQEFCSLTFLNVQKVNFQDTSGESKIKTALFSRMYKVNLKNYTLFNKILDQQFGNIF